MSKLTATVDAEFQHIERLLRELRTRVSVAAEAVHVEAERTAARLAKLKEAGRRQPKARERKAL